jgi:hypothetical protein
MKITVEDNFKEVTRNIDQSIRQQPYVLQTALGRTAEFLMGLIKQRTSRGQDANLATFPPYSQIYKEFRQKKGRQTSYPDLNFTGQMLSNMTQKSTPTYAEIYFSSKAQAIKAMGNNRKRNFFAIGERELTPIMNVFIREYTKLNNIT